MSGHIEMYGVLVSRVGERLFTAYISGENTTKAYEFTGTLEEVYEQICDSQGREA